MNKNKKQEKMLKFPIPDKNNILICTVGGVGKIGMNWTLYGHNGEWILVDAGSGFVPKQFSDIEAVIPEIENFNEILPRLKGLIITHGHEDHIGAVHRLWPMIQCPIYATPFVSEVLKHRFQEANNLNNVLIETFLPGNSFKVGKMLIDSIRLTHSAPEAVGLVINSSAGNIFHTGDWKFDHHPVIGKPSNIKALKNLGDMSKITAMVCDSTNADREGKFTSERDVGIGMEKVFKDAYGMVVVSCFSSNLARIAAIGKAAEKNGRYVALAGYSLRRNEEIARKLGMIKGISSFLSEPSHLKGLDRREKVLICTGAQGEPNASFAKYAFGTNSRLPEVHETDTVIHSARTIPGNEENINDIIHQLQNKGVTIVGHKYKNSPLHATGHATAKELAIMYHLVKPKFVIPVHGENHHMEANKKIALEQGVTDVLLPSEGSIIAVNHNGIEKIAEINIGLSAIRIIDGKNVYSKWHQNIEDNYYLLENSSIKGMQI